MYSKYDGVVKPKFIYNCTLPEDFASPGTRRFDRNPYLFKLFRFPVDLLVSGLLDVNTEGLPSHGKLNSLK